VYVHLDGEVFPAKEVALEVMPKFVRFILPKGSNLPPKEQEFKKETVTA
jgi:diacylglycerol kinase family enzyme